jgi:hypothetical protein
VRTGLSAPIPRSRGKYREFERIRAPPAWPSGLIPLLARGLARRVPQSREQGIACRGAGTRAGATRVGRRGIAEAPPRSSRSDLLPAWVGHPPTSLLRPQQASDVVLTKGKCHISLSCRFEENSHFDWPEIGGRSRPKATGRTTRTGDRARLGPTGAVHPLQPEAFSLRLGAASGSQAHTPPARLLLRQPSSIAPRTRKEREA